MASAFVMFQNQDIVYKAMDHKQSRSLLVSCRCGGSGGSHGVHVSIGSGCRILNDPLLRESDFWVCWKGIPYGTMDLGMDGQMTRPFYKNARMHLTRPDTRPSVAYGWAGGSNAQKSTKTLFLRKRDQWTDGRTDQWPFLEKNGNSVSFCVISTSGLSYTNCTIVNISTK